jgi:hypothetical protein
VQSFDAHDEDPGVLAGPPDIIVRTGDRSLMTGQGVGVRLERP